MLVPRGMPCPGASRECSATLTPENGGCNGQKNRARQLGSGLLVESVRVRGPLRGVPAGRPPFVGLHPRFRPGLQAAAHVLSMLDRDEEAVALLEEAGPHLESNAVFMQLYQMQLELKRYEQARESLERSAQLSPLAEKGMREWFAAQRSEIAYRLGDDQAAIRHAKDAHNEFYQAIADRLENPGRVGRPATVLPSVSYASTMPPACRPRCRRSVVIGGCRPITCRWPTRSVTTAPPRIASGNGRGTTVGPYASSP